MLLALGALAVLIHLPAITQYGYFRDELYYLACTQHMAWGYVDQPPLSIAVLWLVRHTLGDSLVAIRLVPVLIHGSVVYLAGRVARDLGGGPGAQALAALSALIAPMYIGLTHFYSMNALDLLAWAIAYPLLLRALETGSTRAWLLLGLTLGLGLENKISVLWLGSGILAALLLTPNRRALFTRGPWVAGATAAALFLPHVLWQIAHGWPTLEFMRNAREMKMAEVSLGGFVSEQLLVMNPASAAIWATGLAYGLFAPGGRRGRALAIVFLAVLAILISTGRSRSSYLAPGYIPLFALGGIALERLATARARLRWVPAAAGSVLLALGALLLPFALPMLPVERFIAYQRAAGVEIPSNERHAMAELPQHYADMFGWEEMARAVAEAYRSLPPEDRAQCIIYGQNYGEAGAIDFFGPRLGLPRAVSGHNSYWFWGTRGWDGSVMLVIGGDAEDHLRSFERVKQVGVIRTHYSMPYERDLPIWLCRKLKAPVDQVWRSVRMFI